VRVDLYDERATAITTNPATAFSRDIPEPTIAAVGHAAHAAAVPGAAVGRTVAGACNGAQVRWTATTKRRSGRNY